jgi:hydroxybutyrate-dimer hydrolase
VRKLTFVPLSIPLTLLALGLSACNRHQVPNQTAATPESSKPAFAADQILQRYYDGISDDLATAGLGLEGLRQGPPTFTDPLNPTEAELRRSAIYHNYNGLLALKDQDGYGRLYAQHHTAHDQQQNATGIAGYEYIMPVRYSDQSIAAVHMVQVPDSFDPTKPCIVAAPSSGSRGIYGAIGVVGAWALAENCAVAYTDKGSGTGFDWLDANQQHTITGKLTDDPKAAHFAVKRDSRLHKFNAQYPHRVATKHAHSQHLIDLDWGTFVLQAVQMAFYVLNEYHGAGHAYSRGNTTVIAAGISNGGGSVLRAGELDRDQWVDAVVASEPAVNLPKDFSFSLRSQGETQPIKAYDLLHQATLNALLLPCAALAVEQPLLGQALLPLWQARLEQRCSRLEKEGLISGEDTRGRAEAALAELRAHGMLPEAEPLAVLSVSILLWEAVAVNYVNSYGRYHVADHLCDVSYASVDSAGNPVATPPAVKASFFGPSSGIVPTGSLTLINDASNGSPKAFPFSQNANGTADLAFDNLHCLHQAAQSKRAQQGLAETTVSGNLHGKPAIIVHGRADNLIHPNSNARPYVVLNQQREGDQSRLRYYEVTHGQHFDSFLNVPTARNLFIPLQFYFEAALNDMLKHLRTGQALAPSQVVQTQPPGAEALWQDHLPQLTQSPAKPISVNTGVLALP